MLSLESIGFWWIWLIMQETKIGVRENIYQNSKPTSLQKWVIFTDWWIGNIEIWIEIQLYIQQNIKIQKMYDCVAARVLEQWTKLALSSYYKIIQTSILDEYAFTSIVDFQYYFLYCLDVFWYKQRIKLKVGNIYDEIAENDTMLIGLPPPPPKYELIIGKRLCWLNIAFVTFKCTKTIGKYQFKFKFQVYSYISSKKRKKEKKITLTDKN